MVLQLPKTDTLFQNTKQHGGNICHAEIYTVINGEETLVGVFSSDLDRFIPATKNK